MSDVKPIKCRCGRWPEWEEDVDSVYLWCSCGIRTEEMYIKDSKHEYDGSRTECIDKAVKIWNRVMSDIVCENKCIHYIEPCERWSKQ